MKQKGQFFLRYIEKMMDNTKTYLITGGAGFIGFNFVRFLLENEPGAQVVILDLLNFMSKQKVDE